jgi:hypothetical protein
MSATEFDLNIRTPGDWIVVDAAALSDAAEVDALVGDRLDTVPELAGRRGDLVATVTRSLRRAREAGVLFTAVLADVDEEGRPLMANLAVAAAAGPAPVVEDDAPSSAATAGAGAAAAARETPDLEAAFAEQFPDAERRDVTSVLLPGGPAVRLARLFDVPLTDDGPMLAMLSVQYFFSVPGLEQMLVLSFTTPSIAAAERLQQIFHAIAETVSFG